MIMRRLASASSGQICPKGFFLTTRFCDNIFLLLIMRIYARPNMVSFLKLLFEAHVSKNRQLQNLLCSINTLKYDSLEYNTAINSEKKRWENV